MSARATPARSCHRVDRGGRSGTGIGCPISAAPAGRRGPGSRAATGAAGLVGSLRLFEPSLPVSLGPPDWTARANRELGQQRAVGPDDEYPTDLRGPYHPFIEGKPLTVGRPR